jgi:hypothetical protein
VNRSERDRSSDAEAVEGKTPAEESGEAEEPSPSADPEKSPAERAVENQERALETGEELPG